MSSEEKPVGVIGAGSFGTAIANVLAQNRTVYLYTRRQEVVDTITNTGSIRGYKMSSRIKPTTNLEHFAKSCRLMFPVVRSGNFREMIRNLHPFLEPDHILIHGTKGFDVSMPKGETLNDKDARISREHVRTMSEVIMEETVVRRIGCFSGPNLSSELADNQPAGTVVASPFEEVIAEGRSALGNATFKIYESNELIGIELSGALKNVMAIASGALTGLGYGQNARSMLITSGLAEMIFLAKRLGGDTEAFLGLAGVGDLIATCSSELSRNFSVGKQLAKGEKLDDILAGMNDVVEGIHTIKVVNALANHYHMLAPISQTLYKVLFNDMPLEEGINLLMNFPIKKDVAFL